MIKQRKYMTLEELDETLGKLTPYCLYESLEKQVKGITALTVANTVLLVIVAVVAFK